jgi:DNA invertase Pin-like site-specific DNA recombinase
MQQLQRIAIYARVSSEQHSSGQTIASQLEALQARVSSDGQRLPADQCFVDDGYLDKITFNDCQAEFSLLIDESIIIFDY